MHVQTLISLLLIFSLWASCNGIEDVASINITIADENGAPTINTLQITLWFDFTIYQCTLVDPIQAHTYSITTFDILGTSDCDKAPNAASESKMKIENNSPDGVIIDAVSIETTSGAWYGINGRCFDNALEKVQKWLVEPNYSQYVMDELSCASGTSNTFLCLDNEKYDCEPARQIFYFDTTRANQFINDAAWSDGTDVTPQIVSCDPTDNPSYSTTNPTKFPSISPTYLPSFNPTSNTSTTASVSTISWNTTLPTKATTTALTTNQISTSSPLPWKDTTDETSSIATTTDIASNFETVDPTTSDTEGIEPQSNLQAYLGVATGSLFCIVCALIIALRYYWKPKQTKAQDESPQVREMSISDDEMMSKAIDTMTSGANSNNVFNVAAILKGSVVMTRGQKANNLDVIHNDVALEEGEREQEVGNKDQIEMPYTNEGNEIYNNETICT